MFIGVCEYVSVDCSKRFTTSVTRLGDFLMFLAKIILQKQITRYVKTFQGYFLAPFGNNLATFLSNIWSHCLQQRRFADCIKATFPLLCFV